MGSQKPWKFNSWLSRASLSRLRHTGVLQYLVFCPSLPTQTVSFFSCLETSFSLFLSCHMTTLSVPLLGTSSFRAPLSSRVLKVPSWCSLSHKHICLLIAPNSLSVTTTILWRILILYFQLFFGHPRGSSRTSSSTPPKLTTHLFPLKNGRNTTQHKIGSLLIPSKIKGTVFST